MVVRVGLQNVPSSRRLLVRDLSSEYIQKVVVVEGIVREVTDVMPRIKVAVWACKNCGAQIKEVQDGPTLKKPLSCPYCGRRDFELLEDLSQYTDFQKIRIQEPLEFLRGGEQSRHIAVYLEDDLVNRTSPGERIIITGILRIRKTQGKSTVQDKYIEALYIDPVEKEFEELEPSPEELQKIRELASDPEIYDKLVRSIAPTIKGHEKIKEAIALQLFGGVKKERKDGTRTRGNIHILLMGDPGTGKSQLLEYAARLAPKSFYVAGKTVTGAGLTASAEKDEFGEGGWVIKAGVLVLASGGLAAVDEFDKIDAKEREALHEAMEQQTVSVAKAGVVTRFKAETSILAAANPKFGRFEEDPNKPIITQINISPTILNRFDLMFVIREVKTAQEDREIANHILETHRAGEMRTQYEKGTGTTLTVEEVEKAEEIIRPAIDPDLLKKYIAYARTKIFPVLTDEAKKTIMDFYVELREQGREKNLIPINARQLEAIIRLAEASARVRLSNEITKEDAERAIDLLRSSMEEVIKDQSSGEFDVDILYTGVPRTKRKKMSAITDIIREIAEVKTKASFEDILERAQEIGIEKEELEEILDELVRKGIVMQPRPGFYTLV
jgi:replicative DNA helicase Mcm